MGNALKGEMGRCVQRGRSRTSMRIRASKRTLLFAGLQPLQGTSEFGAKTGCKFGFLECKLFSPIVEKEEGHHFCGENWLKGHFCKLNSSAGYVDEAEFKEHSDVAQAFSHFTFGRSAGELLVVDRITDAMNGVANCI